MATTLFQINIIQIIVEFDNYATAKNKYKKKSILYIILFNYKLF